MNYLDKLKIAINSSSIEISFSELKDPVDFLDRRKKMWNIDTRSMA